jgi:hypothetical protein
MSKLHFLLKHGTLDQAKTAVENSNKEVLGHATAMTKLLTRMKSEGDPDYERMRHEHIVEFAQDRIKSSWVVDSEHVKPENLKMIAVNFPHMIGRVAKNKNADADVLRVAYEQAKAHPLRVDGDDVRKIIQHPNVSKDVLHDIATNYEGMGTRAFAQQRLADWK